MKANVKVDGSAILRAAAALCALEPRNAYAIAQSQRHAIQLCGVCNEYS